MRRRSLSFRPLGFAVLLLAGLAGALLLTGEPAWTDDRDLLVEDVTKPYLFILLDTSGSMNQKLGFDVPAVGFGDDPESRIYAAKEALYKVFHDVEDVNFGFAMFDQDGLRVVSKHWLYHTKVSPTVDNPSWPINWPTADPDGLTTPVDSDGDGIIDEWRNDIEGDAIVFGRTFTDGGGLPVPAGTCATPLDLGNATGRARINAYAKLGADGGEVTVMWIKKNPFTYRLTIQRGDPGQTVGDNNLKVLFDLERVSVCGAIPTVSMKWSLELTLSLDPSLGINEFLMVDGSGGIGASAPEAAPNLWPWSDARTRNSCGSDGPHTGGGWESNYDSGQTVGDPNIDPLILATGDVDSYCIDPAEPSTCVSLRPVDPTIGSPYGRSLDRGDVLPFDWQNDNHTAFMQRLTPNYPLGLPDFRIASHLTLDEDTGLYRPKITGRPPIIASGVTPLGEAVLDMRCWYLGKNGNKCGKITESAFFDSGWDATACIHDSDFGCRRPYLIVISDGVNNCPGNDPGSEVSSFKSQAGVKTWGLGVGPSACNKELKFTRPGGGTCVDVDNKEDLERILRDILGTIREETRVFAGAAVPTVQSRADQSVFLSNFTPLGGESVWEGHLHNFLKPVPLLTDKTPDFNHANHQWDAAVVMKTDQYTAADPLDETSITKRRVFYSKYTTSGDWPNARRLFESTTDQAERYDLWRALGLITPDTPDGAFDGTDQETALVASGNAVIKRTLELKSANSGGSPITFLLGDIFHSNPVIVDAPPNTRYFAENAGVDDPLDACLADELGTDFNRGYQCFLQRHFHRRKVMLVGSNDGMLHAFNIGLYNSSTARFDNGSGHELWAYMPRSVMPTVRQLAQGSRHRYSVDGSPSVADVFIDPAFSSSPSEAERRWRTVVVTGLREGGSGYFALDITQPDPIDGDFLPVGSVNQVAGCSRLDTGCGSVAYPSALWEFTDSTDDSLVPLAPSVPVSLDEDRNGAPDLGDTWSTANIGRIRICDGTECDPNVDDNDVVDKFVAVFGGGMDPLHKSFDPRPGSGDSDVELRGNWLYMVDVETGKVIYKRRLEGSAPSDPAAVDTDQDGYLDRIYIGTLAGFLYRVDLVPDANNNFPVLKPIRVYDLNGDPYDDTLRITTDSENLLTWEPLKIFDANFAGSKRTDEPRPIYHPPSVFFVGQLGLYGLAFGTGEREDLWVGTPDSTGSVPTNPDGTPKKNSPGGNIKFQDGRFYVFVDDTGEFPGPALPLQESNFAPITRSSASTSTNFLTDRGLGAKGWALTLRGEERVISTGFSLLGVTIFSTFDPDVDFGDRPQAKCDRKATDDNTCTKVGYSNVFAVNTTNGNALLAGGRSFDITGFVGSPFSEVGTSGSGDEDPPSENDPPPPPTADDLTPEEKAVMEALKDLFPSNCKFTNQRIDIKLVTADNKLRRVASVPVCVIQKNWKEF